MRRIAVALVGLVISGMVVVRWLQRGAPAARDPAAMSPAPASLDDGSRPGTRKADDRTAVGHLVPPAVAGQTAATGSVATPAGPDAAPRRPSVRAIAALGVEPRARDARELTAEEILQAMRDSYARLSSYTDRGRLTRTWHEANRVYVDAPFRTFFKRPLLYRFEWLGDQAPYQESYWANGTGFFVRRGNGQWSRHGSFAGMSPYAGAWHVYAGAWHVVRLLAPEATRPDRHFLDGATRLGDESIDDVPCFHLSGTATSKPLERHLWIGQSDFLVRRIRTVGPHAYNISAKPQYGTGTETVQIDYLDVTTDLSLPNELFYPAQKTGGGK